MEQLVNKNLITLKCVLFCFLAGIGCIFPFLPLHMLAVGLDRGEARLISAVAPCVALLGPAILGPLIDKLSVGRGSTGGGTGPSGSGRLLRVVTAVCLILSAVFYTLLLAVPHTERHEARRPQVLFMCDASGAYVMQEVCEESMRCNRWEGEKSGVLAVNACEYGCADDNLTWVKQEFTTTSTTSTTSTLSPMYNSVANATPFPDLGVEESEDEDYFELNPPHLCTSGQCLVYMQHDARLRVPLSLLAPDPPTDNDTESNWCTYRTGSPSKCVVPPSRLSQVSVSGSSCRAAVRCRVLDPYDEPGGVLAHADCRLVRGDPGTTLGTYFVIRVLADIWPTAALALLGAACVIATRETSLGRGDVGRQLAFGTLGLAIFPPLAGYAADQMPDSPYLVPFVMHAVFMIIGALILLVDTLMDSPMCASASPRPTYTCLSINEPFASNCSKDARSLIFAFHKDMLNKAGIARSLSHMPLSTPEWWWHTATGVLALPMSAVRRYGAETAALGAVLALLGALWGALDTYLPWTVSQLNGTLTDMGLTLTAGALPALPALYWAEALVDYVGHSNLFITAFTFYCLRYTGLAYSESYTWIVVCELLEVFTLSLVWVTAMLYFRHLVPRKYTTTGQALPVIAHFCIGRCLGAIVGGLVSLEDSPRSVHRALGVLSLLSAAVYLALYHLLLAPRCAAPTHAPPRHLLQGLNTNGGSNGNYSPMRVYHEERSRKGHFRY